MNPNAFPIINEGVEQIVSPLASLFSKPDRIKVGIYRVFFLFPRTLKRYNKSNINRLFKSDIFLERRKFQQSFSAKIVLLIIKMMSIFIWIS